jgi:hypothetical protein
VIRRKGPSKVVKMWEKDRLKFCTRSSIEEKDQTTYKKLVKLKPFLKQSKINYKYQEIFRCKKNEGQNI